MSPLDSLLAMGGGIVLLVAGAEGLVRGASSLALRFGITPLVVGLTVVAFGTSSPELVVSLQAALRGEGAVAMGNVVGSNIANLGLIVGTSAALSPLLIDRQLLRRDVPVMLAAMGLLWALSLNGVLGRAEGVLLSAGIVAYTAWGLVASRREVKAQHAGAAVPPEVRAAKAAPASKAWLHGAMALAGLAALVVGSDLLVGGAVAIAGRLGISEAVIGLTLVALGTSLPELATTIVAAIRGHGEIALGGAIGSNVFNVLGVIGPAAAVAPLDTSDLGSDVFAIMLGLGLVTTVFLITGGRTRRWEGAVLLGLYAAYIWWVVPA